MAILNFQKPDKIILQNAECMHTMDILSTANTVNDFNYITFGCYSQGKGEAPGGIGGHRQPQCPVERDQLHQRPGQRRA